MTDILIGTTDYTKTVFIPDPASTDGSGKTGLVAANLTVSYTRVETDNDVIVTDVTSSLNNLAALTTAHTDWGLLEVSSTLAPGLYRLDIADAVFASGAWSAVVYVMITTSAAAASPIEFTLVAVNKLDGVRMGLTALPNAAADASGGLPISDAGGLDLDALRMDVVAILVDTSTTLDGRIPAALVGGRMDASVGAMAANVMTAAAAAADLTTELQSGLATAAALDTVDNFIDTEITAILALIDTEIGAIKIVTDRLDTSIELDGAVYRFTVNALELAPTGGSAPTAETIADAVWDELRADHVGAGSFGQGSASVQGNVTGSVASVTGAVGSVTGNVSGNVTGSVGSVATGGIVAASFAAGAIDAAAIAANAIGASELAADAVTEIQVGLATAAAVAALNNLSAAQVNAEVDTALLDVGVTTTVTGRIDAAITTRASQTSVDDVPTNAELTTALGTADDAVLAQVALVKAKTDNIPADPADASDISSSFGTVNATLTTVASYLDTEVAAIKAKTDSLTFTVAGKVDANPTAINGDAVSAANLAKTTRATVRGTVTTGATTTSIPTSALTPVGAAVDQFKGMVLKFDADTVTAALRSQTTEITASTNAAAPTFTVVALTTAPASSDTFSVQ